MLTPTRTFVAAALLVPLLGTSALAAKKKKSSPPAPAAVKSVVVYSATDAVSLKGKKAKSVFLVTEANPINIELAEGGKLVLQLHQVLGAASKAATVNVAVDDASAKTLTLSTNKLKGTTLAGSSVGTAKEQAESLSGGKSHTVSITSLAPQGVAVAISFVPGGSRKPAPVERKAKATSSLLAAALDLGDDEEEEVEAPPTPAPEPPADPAPEVEAAPPATEPSEAAADPAPPPPVEKSVAERVAAGEIRDGLMQSYSTVALVKGDDEKRSFHRVDSSQSYSMIVAGPGKLTVRLHQLLPAAALAPAAPASEYVVIVFQDDVVLQSLKAKSEATDAWQADGDDLGGRRIGAPKEYLLTLGNGTTRLALQISQAPEGMLVRYDFAPEKATLAALAFDEEEDEEAIAAAPPATPISIMEVDLTIDDRVILAEAPPLLGIALQAGTVVPASGAPPGISAAAQLRLAPFGGPGVALAAHGGVQSTTLRVSVGESASESIDAEVGIISVQVMGLLTGRLALGESLGLYVSAGGGLAWLRAKRRALEAEDTASTFGWSGRGALGAEVAFGPGWIGLEARYLFAPPLDLGSILRDYSASGVGFALQYRLGG